MFVFLGTIFSWDFLRLNAFPFKPFSVPATPISTLGINAVEGTLLAYIALKLTNYFYDKVRAIENAWKDDLSVLLHRAIEIDKPIQVTVDTRKVYVGQIFETIEPDEDSAYLTIIPLFSGHRTEDKLELAITHKYNKVFQMFKDRDPMVEHYRLVIPKSRIVTCHIFDYEIYAQVANQPSDDQSATRD